MVQHQQREHLAEHTLVRRAMLMVATTRVLAVRGANRTATCSHVEDIAKPVHVARRSQTLASTILLSVNERVSTGIPIPCTARVVALMCPRT